MQFPSPPGESGIDTKDYLKLKDKESAVGVFRGEPYFFRQHWVGNRSQICSGTTCDACAQKVKSTFRFKINFITKDAASNVYIAKVFEQAYGTYMSLKSLHEGDYPLNRTIIRITRVGTGLDTTYTILPIPKNEVTNELEKTLRAITLHDLTATQDEPSGPLGDTPPAFDSDIPF